MKKNKSVTAVEWLMLNLHTAKDPFNQAKAMEKQQITDAYEQGYSDSDNRIKSNDNYFEETFNTK